MDDREGVNLYGGRAQTQFSGEEEAGIWFEPLDQGNDGVALVFPLADTNLINDSAARFDKRLECPTCGTLARCIASTATKRTPIRCGGCGDYLGRLGDLEQFHKQMD